MTEAQSAAYVMAQAALLNARIAGMAAENMQRAHLGQSMAYGEDAFAAVAREYQSVLGHNAVLWLFQQVEGRK